jgi:steroid delta-isomerase-like uncharacterized protein
MNPCVIKRSKQESAGCASRGRPSPHLTHRAISASSRRMSAAQTSSLQLIRTYYETFNSGDRGAFLALLADDVAHDINQGGCEQGKEAFRAFLQRMDRCYREQVVDLVVFASEDGRRGAAEFFIEGSYLATDDGLPPAAGQSYRLRVGAFFEIENGLVKRITNYYNLQEWLRQVGAA